jgi:hypothetical protein
MASFPIDQRLSKRSAYAERFVVLPAGRGLATMLAALSNAAMGTAVAILELATLQRNAVVPALTPVSSTRGLASRVEARRSFQHGSVR